MYSFRNQELFLTYPIPDYFCSPVADFGYLEELFPLAIKTYQVKVREAIDQIDYQGSMIYDEYPDAITMYQMAKHITEDIILSHGIEKKIADEMSNTISNKIKNTNEVPGEISNDEMKEKKEQTDDKGPCKLIELIQVLLLIEIQKRRMKKNVKYNYLIRM